MSTAIAKRASFDLTPTSLQEAMDLAAVMAKSELIPMQFRNKPGDVMIAVQMGAELGVSPLQALSGIAVINGRASIWGDLALAVVQKSGLLEEYKEMTFEEIRTAGKAVFWAKRKGMAEPIVREFSIADAKKARLWDKAGPWQQYPERMMQMRARGFGLRDGFADALKGVAIREEVEDYVPVVASATQDKLAALKNRLALTTKAEAVVESQPSLPGGSCPSDDTQHASPDNASDPGSDDARSADRPADTISEKQAKRLFAIAKGRGMTNDQIKYLTKAAGYEHSRDIKTADYEQICSAMESWTIGEHERIGAVLAGFRADEAGA